MPDRPPAAGRIHVVGSLNIDRTMRVPALPAPGETTSAREAVTTPGGKGGNQAVAAARAGGAVRMAGAVGDDADGELVQASLQEAGVDVALVRRTELPTGAATILVDDAAENVIVLVAGANGGHRADDADALLGDTGPGDLVLLQGEIPAAVSQAVAAGARARGARVAWNAAPAPRDRADAVTDVDLLLVNEGELAAVARLIGADGTGTEGAALAVSAATGASVVVTLGAAGALAAQDGATTRVAAPRVRAVDTTAAGDTFVGVLAVGLQEGRPLTDAMARAAAAGALTVTRRGAAASIPDRGEVDQFLAAGPGVD